MTNDGTKGPMSGACFGCVHRRPVASSSLIACAHPVAVDFAGQNPADSPITTMSAADRALLPQLRPHRGIKVDGHSYGIRSGWFAWPYIFDPLWLYSCDGLELAPGAISSGVAERRGRG